MHKKYSKQFIKETYLTENNYPFYARRSPDDGGKTNKIKIRGHGEFIIDKKWIVPYCTLLSRIFNPHINVELWNSIQAIKYTCSNINIGSHFATYTIEYNNNHNANNEKKNNNKYVNEVTNYQSGRYICTNEAIWRILSFCLHETFPAAVHLVVHLENGERINLNDENFNDRINNRQFTTLTTFFKLCTDDPFAKTLYYIEVPKYYT